MSEDSNLKKFFNKKELLVIKEAIEDHRSSSSNEPRSIYGKIVCTADKNTSVETALKRTYEYRKKNYPNLTVKEMMKDTRLHLIDKFGYNGYANSKFYFKDEEYTNYLKDLRELLEDEEKFNKNF